MQDDYLDCEAYGGHEQSEKHKGFSTFEKEGEFYFAMLDLDGEVRMRSEGYKSEAARDNGIESVLKNRKIRERYSIIEEEGKFYLSLKAGNHQEIARSCSYKSKTAARKAMFAWKKKRATAKKSTHVEDYLDCEKYKGHPRSETYPEFNTFKEGDEFYFTLLGEKDEILLRSEGYTKDRSRDNGIKSVTKNREIEKRFLVRKRKGQYFLTLKAGNHQEIGRSCPCDTEAAALIIKDKIMGVKADRNLDDYLDCPSYKGHERLKEHSDFSTFNHDGESYFAMLAKDNDVIFRSEGYKSEKARDNGIQSVLKNKEIEERYSVVEGDGKYFLTLKAGNHQEIARSCPCDSEAAAWAWKDAIFALGANGNLDDYLDCHLYKGHERTEHTPDFSTFEKDGEHYFAMLDKDDEVFFRSEGYTTEKARNNGILSVIKNREIEKRYHVIEDEGKHYLTLKAGNHQEIARSCSYGSAAAATAAMFYWKEKNKAASIDEYLHCDEYKNHVRSDIHSDFSTFEKDGEHYFAMLDRDGGVILRSEGYTTTKARDNGIQSVLKNREVEGRYSVLQDRHHYFAILKAGNHQEIGRSCPYLDEAAALASMTAWHPYEATAPTPKKREDNYLKCDLYKGHERHAEYSNFSTFEHEGEHYFTFLDKDDEVVLRSEGYTTTSARDNGIKSVIKNWPIEERRSVIEKFGHYFVILKAGNHQEIGRSCPKSDEAGALLLFGPLAGVAATALVPPIVVPPVVPEPEIVAEETPPPPPPPAPEPEPVPIADPAPVAAAGASGCMRFWWLLPLLLLLLGLLWLLMRGCGGDGQTAVVPPVVPEMKKEESTLSQNDDKAVSVAPPAKEVAPEPEPPANLVVKLESIFFDYNKYGLRTKSKQELDKMADILLKNEKYTGELLAHTDYRGSLEYNQWLSRKRATAAKDYLVAKGVPANRIKWRNFGENDPIAKNELNGQENEQGMQFNRRVELRILDGSKNLNQIEEIKIPDNLKVK